VSAEHWNSGSVLIQHFRQLGATEIDTSPWIRVGIEEDSSGLAPTGTSKLELRELRMRTSVPPAPMCPKTTRVTATLCLIASVSKEGSASLTIMSSKISHDVPFGDKFLVQEKVELTPRCAGETGVDLRISGRVVFLQTCGMLQSRINSNIMSQLEATAEALASRLRLLTPVDWAVDEEEPENSEDVRTEYVWELQRRVTAWSSVWHAPFLPHDGFKRLRWVSPDYKPHALQFDGACPKRLARCEVPPLCPPHGWMSLGDWQPERSAKTTCDGWQHAVDFYSAGQLWCKSPFALHVRRRRWVCRYRRI